MKKGREANSGGTGKYKELKNLNPHMKKVSRKCLIDEEQIKIKNQPFGKNQIIITTVKNHENTENKDKVFVVCICV